MCYSYYCYLLLPRQESIHLLNSNYTQVKIVLVGNQDTHTGGNNLDVG